MKANSIHRDDAKRDAIVAIPLVLLILIVFGRLCAAEFVQFDDPQTIANNPAFNPPQIAQIAQYWIKPEGNLYIPLTYSFWGTLSFIARVTQPDESGSFLNPWVFHTANVVLHCVTTLIAFAILREIVKTRFAAWFGAAFFAIHPVQVETVAWASGTKDLLCALFAFAAILALIRYRETRRKQTIVLGTLFMLAACLSKPTGIIAPAMAFVIDTLIFRKSWRQSLATLSIWFVLAVTFAIIGKMAQPPVTSDVPPLWSRPLIATDALAFYIYKVAWPIEIGIDYGHTPSRISANLEIYWTWIIPTMLAMAAYAIRIRFGGVALLLALIGVAPVLGFIPFTFQTISTVSDHYLYPSMLGVALLIAAIIPTGKKGSIVGGALIAALSIRSFLAAGVWQNNSTLFANALSVNPRSAMSHTNWGVALAQHGDQPAAMEHFGKAVEVDPDYAFGHLNLASALQARGQYAAAAREYRELLRVYRKQRNFSAEMGVNLQRVIDQLERLAAHSTTTLPASREARDE